MKTNKDGIEIKLTEKQDALIRELAELQGKSYQDTLNEVINKVLAKELPALIERRRR